MHLCGQVFPAPQATWLSRALPMIQGQQQLRGLGTCICTGHKSGAVSEITQS